MNTCAAQPGQHSGQHLSMQEMIHEDQRWMIDDTTMTDYWWYIDDERWMIDDRCRVIQAWWKIIDHRW